MISNGAFMSQSPRLSLSYIEPQQAQKHVTVNESFRRLDALVQLTVAAATVEAEPSMPGEGDAYLVPAGASGPAWGAAAVGDIAVYQDGEWRVMTPNAGWRAFIAAEQRFVYFDGAAWVGEAPDNALRFGVNTTADAVNRFAVKSDAALLSHDDATPGSGDMRVVVNKNASLNTAGIVLQTGYSGRAEIALAGNDDLSVKVSADGAIWRNALTVKSDGKVGLNTTAPASPLELHVDGSSTNASLISSDDFVLTKESGPSSFAGVIASAGASDRMVFKGTKARGTLSSPTAAAAGDLTFTLLGSVFDGATTRGTASIEMRVDGAVSSGVAPQRIEFMTGAGASRTERMRITPAGDVGIGVTAPSSKLDVDGPVKVKSYLKTAVPSAAASGAGAIIYVSNEAGGAVLAFSDGSAWRRVTDRAVIS